MKLGELKKHIDEIIANDPTAIDSKVYAEINGNFSLELKDIERLIVNTYLKFGLKTLDEEEDDYKFE